MVDWAESDSDQYKSDKMVDSSESDGDQFDSDDSFFFGDPIEEDIEGLRYKIDRETRSLLTLREWQGRDAQLSLIRLLPKAALLTEHQKRLLDRAVITMRNRVTARKVYMESLLDNGNSSRKELRASLKMPPDMPPRDPLSGQIDEAYLLEELGKLFGDVFKLCPHNEFLVSPHALMGVPATKISRGSRFWKDSWIDLDPWCESVNEVTLGVKNDEDGDYEMIKKDVRKEEKKEEAEADEEMVQEEDWEAENDVHSDYDYDAFLDSYAANQEARFLRRVGSLTNLVDYVWGDGSDAPYHPNQLVAEHFQNEGGMCASSALQYTSEAIAYLKWVQQKGLLGMPAHHFYRWRVACKVAEHHDRQFVRFERMDALIEGIGREGNEFTDPVLVYALQLGRKIDEEEPMNHAALVASLTKAVSGPVANKEPPTVEKNEDLEDTKSPLEESSSTTNQG